MNQITWARLLAYVTGLVNQELLLQNEYLVAENRILKAHQQPGLRLSDGEKATLAEIGKRLGRKALQQVAHVAKPDTILGWFRKLVAAKFDGSKQRRSPGRPRIRSEIEDLVVRLARENAGWGYDRIVGALANLGARCLTRPWATSCAGTASRQRRSGVKRRPGRSSFAGIWMFSRAPTSSRSRC
jgi:putative transposase